MPPKVTAQECPTSTATTAISGVNPRVIISGAQIAAGTPKPAIPSMKPAKVQPHNIACPRRLTVILDIDPAITCISPRDFMIL